MPHTPPRQEPTPPQPTRTRGSLEDGAVGLHAERLRHRPPGTGAPTKSVPQPPEAGGSNGQPPPNGRERRRLAPLFAAGGVAGLATAVWGLARTGRSTPPVAPTLPAPTGTWQWRGHQIATYQRGEGRPVVLVHSIHAAASGREMRPIFDRLARDRAVHAYDLLGFGASARPPITYRADLYVDLLGDFLTEVVGEPSDVVASSLSGGHALHAACRWPERFRSLVVVNPTGLVTLADGRSAAKRITEAAFRVPLLGDALFNALVSRPSLAWYDRRAYCDLGRVGRDTLEQQWETAHQPNARFAPAAFIGNRLAINVARALRRLTVPALAIWTPPTGFQDTEAESRAFAHLNPHLASRVIEDCGGVPHEERPADFEAVVREWWEGMGEASPRPVESISAP